MRTRFEIAYVGALLEAGVNDAEIADLTDVPRATIRHWRVRGLPGRAKRESGCDRCNGRQPRPPQRAYAYLLGLYLGDGCISEGPRTYRIRFTLDAAYPGIVSLCATALEAVVPGKRAARQRRGYERAVEVGMYWNHWPCLFPQHGPGRKHLRSIVLEPWQARIVRAERRPFIRGLIHSDGCRVVANDRGRPSVRYHFANLSEDIKRLYCESLDALGIRWTRPSDKDIAVYRKASVAIMDRFVGPKI